MANPNDPKNQVSESGDPGSAYNNGNGGIIDPTGGNSVGGFDPSTATGDYANFDLNAVDQSGGFGSDFQGTGGFDFGGWDGSGGGIGGDGGGDGGGD